MLKLFCPLAEKRYCLVFNSPISKKDCIFSMRIYTCPCFKLSLCQVGEIGEIKTWVNKTLFTVPICGCLLRESSRRGFCLHPSLPIKWFFHPSSPADILLWHRGQWLVPVLEAEKNQTFFVSFELQNDTTLICCIQALIWLPGWLHFSGKYMLSTCVLFKHNC